MSKSDKNTYVDGIVREALPNTMYKISVSEDHFVLCTIAGKLRRGFVRIFPGDRVKVELTPYDQKRGRIVQKYQTNR